MALYDIPNNFDFHALAATLREDGFAVGLRWTIGRLNSAGESVPDKVEINPALTPAQETRLNTLIARIQEAQSDTAQAEQIRADLLTYRESAEAYLALTSPTNAQSVAAIKALIRIAGLLARLVFILMDYRRQTDASPTAASIAAPAIQQPPPGGR